jgi:ATP-binding cassette, subfamily B, bacterial PglK
MLIMVQKVLDLFEPGERWALGGILGLIVLMALVQTVGVASILPFMSLVATPELIQENRWLAFFYDYFGFQSTRSFLIAAGVLVLAITAFSNAFTALTFGLLMRFVWSKQHSLSVRLLRKYLYQPYSFYLNRNTAGLAKNILEEVREAINGVVMPGMKMIAQAVVAFCIIVLLLLVDVTLAVVSIVVLGGAYGLVYSIVRTKQGNLGRTRTKANGGRFKAASEALGGIKETKVLGREEEFLERFSNPAGKFARTNASNAIISEIPKYALETIAFGGILVMVLYILTSREDFGQAVAVISLYALAGYRLMPALQQVFTGLTKVRFYAAGLENLHADLVDERSRRSDSPGTRGSSEPVQFEQEIQLDRVSFTYPGSDQIVLREVTLAIPKNSTVGLVGATGSGKTTIVDIILRLLEPDSGFLRVDGVPITANNELAWRRKIGYVPQNIFLCDDKIARNIAFGVREEEIDLEAVEQAARLAHLHSFVVGLPSGYDTVVGDRGVRLSGGQRQRIGIARALYHNPDVLILDEATSALDGITEDGVMSAIQTLSGAKTIILVAHRLTTLQTCDTIFFFEQGEVVDFGTYPSLLATNDKFRAMAKDHRSAPVTA